MYSFHSINVEREFEVPAIMEKIGNLEQQLIEEQAKDERDNTKEIELLYARFMAGLKLNTNIKYY